MTATSTTTGARIEVRDLTKTFGSFTAVDHLSFQVEPGRITGFLGPNGAGKTTSLRMLLGLIHPTSGTATIDGQNYHDLDHPMSIVGSALEATNFHPGRTGRDHLRVLAAASGLPDSRVDELLELTGIPAAARKRAGEYSMGMRQRLGLAAALLGDPRVLILDEPSNGLDPEGIRWLRGFLRHLSGEGKTILVSSHQLQEVEQTVDDVVIIANGRLVREGAVSELRGAPTTLVRTSDPAQLAGALRVADVMSRPRRRRGAHRRDGRPAPRGGRGPARRFAHLGAARRASTTSRRSSSSSPKAPTATSETALAPRARPMPSLARKGRTSDGQRHQVRVPQVLHHPPVVGHGHRPLRPRRPSSRRVLRLVRVEGATGPDEGSNPFGAMTVQAAQLIYTAGLIQSLTTLLPLAIGIMQIGSEYRHKTISSHLARRRPSASRAMLAKIVCPAGIGAVYGRDPRGRELRVGGASSSRCRGPVNPLPGEPEVFRSLGPACIALSLWTLLASASASSCATRSPRSSSPWASA